MTKSRLYDSFDDIPDNDIWRLACLAVCAAGLRAHERGQSDIENVCIGFVEVMSLMVGMPPVPFETGKEALN